MTKKWYLSLNQPGAARLIIYAETEEEARQKAADLFSDPTWLSEEHATCRAQKKGVRS